MDEQKLIFAGRTLDSGERRRVFPGTKISDWPVHFGSFHSTLKIGLLDCPIPQGLCQKSVGYRSIPSAFRQLSQSKPIQDDRV